MQQEIEWCGWVDTILVYHEDVSFKLLEHLEGEAALKQRDEVLKRKNHLLVQFDRNFETQCVDNSEKTWLHVGIAAQVGVRNVDSVQDCLVEALGLD